MAEIWFYHLMHQPLEKALPVLVEKSRGRGWKVVIRAGSSERIAVLDDLLWTYDDESFLAHGTMGEADAAEHPVLLTTQDDRPNGAEVLFLVDNAALPVDYEGLSRVVMIFDGNDPEAVDAARAAWKMAKPQGHDVQYWQQDENGRWSRKA